MNNILGTQIIINDLLVDTVEDWSQCRSRSRAERRRRKGHHQRVATKSIPSTKILNFAGKLVMHSSMYKLLRDQT